MTVQITDFAAFFAAVNDGHEPFAWQTDLLERLADTGRWPDRIAAPTGSGKSSAIEIHVFANALAAIGAGARVPRRLVPVVDRRALVDSHALRADRIAGMLAEPDSELLAEVAAALSTLSVGGSPPVQTAVLRGGIPRDSRWLADPSACAIICATPAMFGSRLLFRGYGSSRLSRPREAGLLAMDTAMLLDEAHLNRQLLVTARRVAQLATPLPELFAVPVLQVVETTATPATGGDDGSTTVGVDEKALTDPVLRKRLKAAKPLQIRAVDAFPTRPRATGAYLDELATAVIETRGDRSIAATAPRASTVGCIVNHVDTAIGVAERLRRIDKDLRIELRVGRMRPYDIAQQMAAKPGLFTVAGDPDTDVLITTQVVEVGIDIDLAGLVTELAPATALAQRFGRVNRLGLRERAPIVVLTPEGPVERDRPPYRASDLTAAQQWLTALADDAGDASPWEIAVLPPPASAPRRILLQRPEVWDSERWAQTTVPLAIEEDLTLFLDDELGGAESGPGVVVRAGLPESDDDALSLLAAVPPQYGEVFPAGYRAVSELLKRVEVSGDHRRAFVYSGAEMRSYDFAALPEERLRPGDVIVVDDTHLVHTDNVVVVDPKFTAEAVPWSELDGIDQVVIGRTDVDAADLEDMQIAREEDHLPGQIMCSPGDGSAWTVVLADRTVAADEDLRQEWSPSGGRVLLSDHARDVADRADALCAAIGLGPVLRSAVVAGGLHHDDGKADMRFQTMLGARGEQSWAKSSARSAQAQRAARARSALPTGWRHEQYSVVLADREDLAPQIRDLVLRLVGTSHGHGRPLFPHNADHLCGPAAEECTVGLFDEGGWETLIARTQTEYGVWGTAYLEALVRAADTQISQEGR